MKNCTTCKWEPEWEAFSGIHSEWKKGKCRHPFMAKGLVTKNIPGCLTVLRKDPILYSDGSIDNMYRECPTWVAKEDNQ